MIRITYSISIGWGEGAELYYIGQKVCTGAESWEVGRIERVINDDYTIYDINDEQRVCIINQPITVRYKYEPLVTK